MNEIEKTALIAEWMGMEITRGEWPSGELKIKVNYPRCTPELIERAFRPYHDENHARQAIERLMEDEKLFLKFLSHFVVLDSVSDGRKSIINYMKATLTERMNALGYVIESTPVDTPKG